MMESDFSTPRRVVFGRIVLSGETQDKETSLLKSENENLEKLQKRFSELVGKSKCPCAARFARAGRDLPWALTPLGRSERKRNRTISKIW